MSDEFGGYGGDMYGFDPFKKPEPPKTTVEVLEIKEVEGLNETNFKMSLKIGNKYITVLIPDDFRCHRDTRQEADTWAVGLNFITPGHYQ